MLAQGLSFRQATQDDLPDVHQVYSSVCAWLHDVKGITEQWDRLVPEEEIRDLILSNELYVAFLDGKAAGAFKLTETDQLWEKRGDALYIHAFAVHRKFAGAGLGKKMIEWAGDLAREWGKRYLRLDCMDENSGLKQYYIAAGFDSLGRHPQNTWSALFEKKLESV